MAEAEEALDWSLAARAFRPALLAACVVLGSEGLASAQLMQPMVTPAPDAPGFLTRYDFQLSLASLMPPTPTPPPVVPDTRFSWDGFVGGSFDVADFAVIRAGAVVSYEAMLGSEYRPFDPNAGNYTLEGFVSGRLDANTEVAAIFHHVSRHLSDRPKVVSVAYNEVGGRLMHNASVGATTFEMGVEGGRAVEHSYVDYTWVGEGEMLARHPVNDQLGLYAHGIVQVFAVNAAIAGRGTQTGALIEGGVRLKGRAGAIELFAGYEQRVDAEPLDRQGQRWGLAGVRLLSR